MVVRKRQGRAADEQTSILLEMANDSAFRRDDLEAVKATDRDQIGHLGRLLLDLLQKPQAALQWLALPFIEKLPGTGAKGNFFNLHLSGSGR